MPSSCTLVHRYPRGGLAFVAFLKSVDGRSGSPLYRGTTRLSGLLRVRSVPFGSALWAHTHHSAPDVDGVESGIIRSNTAAVMAMDAPGSLYREVQSDPAVRRCFSQPI